MRRIELKFEDGMGVVIMAVMLKGETFRTLIHKGILKADAYT